MRTGVKKQDKTTEISFNEASPIIEIRTHNTDLKKRLTEYSRIYPDLCKLIYEDAELGYMEFQIVKPRLSFRLIHNKVINHNTETWEVTLIYCEK